MIEFTARAEGYICNTRVIFFTIPSRIECDFFPLNNMFLESAKLYECQRQLGGNERLSVQVEKKNNS